MLPTLERALTMVEGLLGDQLGTRDLCTLWIDLVEFRKNLDVVVRSVEEEATESLVAEVGEVSGKRSLFDTPAGPVHLVREPPRRKAWGYDVCVKLASPMADVHGEVHEAVPVEVLRAVLPAASSPGQTGYGWRWRELRQALGADTYALLVDETPIEQRRLVIKHGDVWS